MMLAVAKEDEERTLEAVRLSGEMAYVIGSIEESREKGIELC